MVKLLRKQVVLKTAAPLSSHTLLSLLWVSWVSLCTSASKLMADHPDTGVEWTTFVYILFFDIMIDIIKGGGGGGDVEVMRCFFSPCSFSELKVEQTTKRVSGSTDLLLPLLNVNPSSPRLSLLSRTPVLLLSYIIVPPIVLYVLAVASVTDIVLSFCETSSTCGVFPSPH